MNVKDVVNQQAEKKAVLAEESTVDKNGNWSISIPKSRIHTLEDLIAAFEIDLTVWEVERFVANKWEMGYTTGVKANKKSEVEPLYQVKAFLRRKQHILDAREEVAELMRLSAENFQPHPVEKQIPSKGRDKGHMLEVNLTDHHFGKLAWQLETLFANYDAKIATAVFWRALNALLERSPFDYYEEIWFVVGNDLFNADNVAGTTTSGTQVQSDVRIRKTYYAVQELMVRSIEILRERADKVKVIVVPGNHDNNTAWTLGAALELYFSKDSDVEVDNMPQVRKYHVYGNTLIGYTHGDKAHQKDLPLLMTTEAREQFGRTKFHEWHTGHFHKTQTDERNGIRVRVLPALCPPDKWHSEMGFVGNLRSSEAYYWDRVEGLTNIIIYTDSDDLIEKATVIGDTHEQK